MRSQSVQFPVLAQNGRLLSATTTPEELSELPFLFGAFPGNRPKQEMLLSTSQPAPEARYIFHTAFCCSTLLARALDYPGRNLSLKEPDILMQLANAQRMKQVEGQEGFLRQTEKQLFGLSEAANETVIVKPTNAANRLAKDMLSNPNCRAIMIHSDMQSFLLSIVRKGEEGRAFCRRLLNIFRMDSAFVGGIAERDLLTLTDLQVAALVWCMQCDQLNEAAAIAPGRVRALHCDLFLEQTEAVLRDVRDFLGLSLTDAEIKEQYGSDVFRTNSKDNAQGYDSTLRAEDRKKGLANFEDAIAIVTDWASKLPLPSELTVRPVQTG